MCFVTPPLVRAAGNFARMKLVIRNMVCDRCKAAVAQILCEFGLQVRRLDLGEADLGETPSPQLLARLGERLEQAGFGLVDGRNAALITRIKAAVVKLVHHDGTGMGAAKLSDHLSAALHREYSGLSQLFSQVEGITIEQYFLLQRLERVKELIRYDEMTLSEIADRTGFSSVAHLSAQFKKLTGMTPTAFKGMGSGRTGLDRVG